MTTTPEAERLAEELRRYADLIEDEMVDEPKRCVGDAGDCAAPVMRQAADALSALSQPDEARDAARWRFVTSHAAEEQNEVAICGMGTFVGGGPQNGLRVWGASFGVDAEALVDAAMSKEQP